MLYIIYTELQYIHDNINEISNIKKSIYDNFILECIILGRIKII